MIRINKQRLIANRCGCAAATSSSLEKAREVSGCAQARRAAEVPESSRWRPAFRLLRLRFACAGELRAASEPRWWSLLSFGARLIVPAEPRGTGMSFCRTTSYASVIVRLERIEDSIPATIEVEDQHVHYKHWIVPLTAWPKDSVPLPLKSSKRGIGPVHVSHLISRRCESAARDRSVTIVVQWRSEIQLLDASLHQVWKQQMGKGRKLPCSHFFLIKHKVNDVGQARISFSVAFFQPQPQSTNRS